MTAAIVPIHHALAMDMYGLLRELDPNHWTNGEDGPFHARLNELRDRLVEVMQSLDSQESAPAIAAVRSRLAEMRQAMESHAPNPDVMGAWEEFRSSMVPVYERYAASLRHLDIHVPSLRPTNYARNVYHVSNALFAMICLRIISELHVFYIATFMMSLAWTLEVGRRVLPGLNDFLMQLLGRLAHPHEAWRVNSATWFCTACFILTCTSNLPVASVGLVVLGFADPAAAILGRRYGRHTLVNGRTLEGTGAFIAVGTVAAFLWLSIAWSFPLTTALLMAFVGATAGGIAELFSRRIDDNLSIPIATAGAVLLLQTVL